MKGLHLQFESIVHFLEGVISNQPDNPAMDCFILNIQKTTFESLKLVNIIFNDLQDHIPKEVRLSFAKAVNKMKEYYKTKPKPETDKQFEYKQQYDEVSHFLQNRPEIVTNNAERGELLKFLALTQEKQSNTKMMLDSMPRYSFDHVGSQPNKLHNYFRQNSTNNVISQHASNFNQILRPISDNQDNYTENGSNQIGNCYGRIRNSTIKKEMVEKQCQTQYGITGIKQIITDFTLQNLHTFQMVSEFKKQITDFLEDIIQNPSKIGKQLIKQNKIQTKGSKTQSKKQTNLNSKTISKVESKKDSAEKKNDSVNSKANQNNKDTEGKQSDIKKKKDSKKIRKDTLQSKKDDAKNKASNSGRNSFSKNSIEFKGDQIEEKNKQMKQANIKQIFKSSDKMSLFKREKDEENIKRQSLNIQKKHSILQENEFNINQHKKEAESGQSNYEKIDVREIASKLQESKHLTVDKIMDQTVADEVKNQQQFESESDKYEEAMNHKQHKKSFNSRTKIVSTKDEVDSGAKIIQQAYSTFHKKIIKNTNLTAQSNGQDDPTVLPKIPQKSTAKLTLLQKSQQFKKKIYAHSPYAKPIYQQQNKINKYSSMNQFNNRSLHMSNSQTILAKKDSNQSLYLNDGTKQGMLEKQREMQQSSMEGNESYKKFSKKQSKEMYLSHEHDRFVQQIQESTNKKKTKQFQWAKVISKIREYESMHARFCGQNCVHLQKFYDFLKKKNLSMYINRKQLYLHKKNIQINTTYH